jgi:transposase
MNDVLNNLESLGAEDLRDIIKKIYDEQNLSNEKLIASEKALHVEEEKLRIANEKLRVSNDAIRTSQEHLHVAQLYIKVLLLKVLGINLERRKLPMPEMLDLFADAGIATTAEASQQPVVVTKEVKPRVKRKPEENRQELPAELPRVVKVLDIPEEEKVCPETGKPLRLLGVAVTESLEIEAPKFYVVRYERPQYVCVDHPEEGVCAMSLPNRIIPKGIAGESLLTFILTSKFIDHMPMERICKMLERSGVTLSRKTVSDWVITCGRSLEPLRLALQRKILESRIVNADETTYKVISNHSKGKPVNGYLWGFVGDKKHLLFEWNDGRSSSHPLAFLAGASCEWLQTDAYSGYGPVLAAYPSMRAVGCWAHVRRKFAETEKIGELAAKPYLDLIAELYAVEKEIREKELSADDALTLREEISLPILASLIAKANYEKGSHLPKSPMGKAIAYMENHWNALIAYATDGDVEIDNNIIERAIRPVALGRKNWLFSGSDTGAQTAALVISLVGTCKLCNVDPAKYLRNVLRILPNFQGEDYADLLPDVLANTLDELDKLP